MLTRLLVSITFLISAFPALPKAQDVVNPSRMVVFTDGARITQKGILRFNARLARFSPFVMPLPGTVEIARSQEYNLQFMKFLEVPDTQLLPVKDWSDLLEASMGRPVVITYEIGKEYDEIAGQVLDLDRSSGIFLIRNKNGQDVFMPLKQVKQVIMEHSTGSLMLPRVVNKPMIEIGIDKDLQFAPVEFTGNIPGLKWIPNCRIRLVDGKTARFQMSAVLENNSGSHFESTEMELAAGSMNADAKDPRAASWRYKPGKLSLRSGESLYLNLNETSHEYEVNYTCSLPWKGPGPETRSEPQPVMNSLRFTTPVSTAVACESITVLDAEGKFLAEATPSGGEVSLLPLGKEAAIKLSYQENGEYEEAKTVKQGDKVFKKVKFSCRIVVSNLRADAVSLKINREISGDVTDAGGGSSENSEKSGMKNLSWTKVVRPGGSETIPYEYYTLIPQD